MKLIYDIRDVNENSYVLLDTPSNIDEICIIKFRTFNNKWSLFNYCKIDVIYSTNKDGNFYKVESNITTTYNSLNTFIIYEFESEKEMRDYIIMRNL